MPGTSKRKSRRRWSWWSLAFGAVGLILVVSATGGVGYAAQLENKDAFCASCHTEPESQFVNLAQSVPVDLASAHAAKGVECIQCHSGRGTVGRVTAMASVALPDLIAFRLGHYAQPAVTTKPMGDDHCLKCHASVTQNRDFNNHFHAFLPLWQARDPQHAATCESCHVSHVTGGDPQTAFLVESTTVAVCQRCHAFAGG